MTITKQQHRTFHQAYLDMISKAGPVEQELIAITLIRQRLADGTNQLPFGSMVKLLTLQAHMDQARSLQKLAGCVEWCCDQLKDAILPAQQDLISVMAGVRNALEDFGQDLLQAQDPCLDDFTAAQNEDEANHENLDEVLAEPISPTDFPANLDELLARLQVHPWLQVEGASKHHLAGSWLQVERFQGSPDHGALIGLVCLVSGSQARLHIPLVHPLFSARGFQVVLDGMPVWLWYQEQQPQAAEASCDVEPAPMATL